jgi:hypothetical protein
MNFKAGERTVTLGVFSSLIEAQLVRSMLESEDIPCFLTNEFYPQGYIRAMPTQRDIRIMVNYTDFVRAQRLFEDYSYGVGQAPNSAA